MITFEREDNQLPQRAQQLPRTFQVFNEKDLNLSYEFSANHNPDLIIEKFMDDDCKSSNTEVEYATNKCIRDLQKKLDAKRMAEGRQRLKLRYVKEAKGSQEQSQSQRV